MLASLATTESLMDQQSIAQQVFATMADMELTPCDIHPSITEATSVASVLHYTKPSEGTMLVECSPELAFAFTARLMSIARPSSLNADVADAMREMVNMIGGNLKGLMPEETCVSIPQVLVPGERDEILANSKRLSRLCFSSGLDHCCISLLESK